MTERQTDDRQTEIHPLTVFLKAMNFKDNKKKYMGGFGERRTRKKNGNVCVCVLFKSLHI